MNLRDLSKRLETRDTAPPTEVTEIAQVDGVPVFWGDEPGPLTVTLAFRVGQADESLRSHGLTRLIYELVVQQTASSPITDQDGVQRLTTSFSVTGPDDNDVVERFNTLVRTLVALPPARLAHTRSEMLQHPQKEVAWIARLQTARFGIRGYGLMSNEELGLHDVTWDALDEWRQQWFTAGNAVLSLSRKSTARISLAPLPSGTRKTLPTPYPLEQPLPGWHQGSPDHLTASFVAPDTAAAWLTPLLLQDRLRQRLVTEDAVCREVSVGATQLGGGLVLIHLRADAIEEHQARMQPVISAELFRFSMSGPDPDELDAARAGRRRTDLMRSSSSHTAAHARALRELFKTSTYQGDDSSIKISPANTAQVARTMLATGIWLLPPDLQPTDKRLTSLTESAPGPVTGNTFPPVETVASDRSQDRLILGESGVTITTPSQQPETVRFADCVAMQVWPDGARTLWSDNGSRVFVHYGFWSGGDQVVPFIDANVDPWLAIIMDSPSGYVAP